MSEDAPALRKVAVEDLARPLTAQEALGQLGFRRIANAIAPQPAGQP